MADWLAVGVRPQLGELSAHLLDVRSEPHLHSYREGPALPAPVEPCRPIQSF